MPPQSGATKAGFFEKAAYYFQLSMTVSGEALRAPYVASEYAEGDLPAIYCTAAKLAETIPPNENTVPIVEVLVGNLATAASRLREAVDGAVYRNVAHAEAEPTRTPDSAIALRAAWSDPFLSRGRAAQLLFGTVEETTEPVGYGLPESCALPPLTDRGGRSLEYLRASGVSPALTRADMAIESFLETAAGEPGVIQRIQSLHEFPAFETADHVEEFLDAHGLSTSDMVEARAYLRCELDAFPRDETAFDTTPEGIDLYDATNRAPTHSRGGELWSDVLAEEARYQVALSGSTPSWDPNLAMRGAAYALDYARRIAVELTSAEVVSEPGIISTEGINYLGLLGSQTNLTTEARVGACANHASAEKVDVRVIVDDDGSVPSADYLIVSSSEALECATHGSVAGESCTLGTGSYRDVSPTPTTPPTSSGYSRRLTFLYMVDNASAGVRDYVVRRRSGLSGRPAGGFDLVAPVRSAPISLLTTLNLGEQFCDTAPAGTHFEDKLEDSLSPDPESPTEPEVSCAEFNTALPLEAELSDDGDRYETSWRRQLEIARLAAANADALGDAYIAAGLAADTRAENASRQLQGLCGVTIDLSTLFAADLSDTIGGACSTGCADGYSCMGGACVADLAARIRSATDDARTLRILGDCLGAHPDSVVPVASLGTAPLCVWRKKDDVSLLCDPTALLEGQVQSCPFVRTGPACPDLVGVINTVPDDGYEVVPVEHQLEIFDERRNDDTPSGTHTVDETFDCVGALRELRSVDPLSLEAASAIHGIIESAQFQLHRVEWAAGALGWTGEPGNHFTITKDYTPVFWTGDPAATELADRIHTGSWPCAVELTPAECPPGSEALFCSAVDCSTELGRAAAARRTARAMIALGVLSGYGLSNLKLPLVSKYNAPTDSQVPEGGEPLQPQNLYLGDEPAAPVSVLVRDFGGYRDSGLYNFSGRGYQPISGSGLDVPFWTSFVGGLDANDEECYPAGCALNLTDGSPAPSVASRQFNYIAFANFGDSVWRGSEVDRVGWLADFWAGMTPVIGPSSIRENSAYSALIRSYALGEGGIIVDSTVLRDRTNLQRRPIGIVRISDDGETSANWGRLIQEGSDASPNGFTRRDVLDAMELICYAHSPEADAVEPACLDPDADPPSLTSGDDLPAVRNYVKCLARGLEEASERMVIQNVPRLVLESSRGEGAAIAPLEGNFGAAIANTRVALLGLREQPRAIGTQLRAFEADLAGFEIQLRRGDINNEIMDWRTAQEAVSTVGTCASATISAAQGSGAGLATCAAAVANLGISFRIRDLRREEVSLDQLERLTAMRSRMEDRIDALMGIDAQTTRLLEQLNGSLATLNGIQASGRNYLAEAMFDSSIPGRETLGELPYVSPITVAESRRYTTAAERYDRAFTRASLAAELARRSIEQRFGMSIADMDDLVLVDRDPADLVRSACEFEGLDYGRIRSEGWTDDTGAPRTSYADGYIGDYVADLQAVVDSYPYAYPYTDGTDVAVISLRDDIDPTRVSCRQPSRNVLYGTASIVGSPMWPREGCIAEATDPRCIAMRGLGPLDSREMAPPLVPGPRLTARISEVPVDQTLQGFRLDFGSVPGSGGALDAAAALTQSLSGLTPGTYRMSWYGRQVGAGVAPGTTGLLTVDGAVVGATTSSLFSVPAGTEILATGWERYYFFVDVLRFGDVRVAINGGLYPDQAVELAGLMLERTDLESAGSILTPDTNPARYYPSAFAGTGEDGLTTMTTCEDTFGTEFRATGWESGCERLCADGFGGTCVESSPEPFCYWQRSFVLSHERIAAGEQLAQAGFAYGNFNYRIERVGVNIVGRRDCSSSASPSTCYASGSSPFSIYHDGPFEVSNHMGGSVEVPLFNGAIEHGRALTAERYLTNPMSSADSSLLASYMRDDLNGRPLDGLFRFRIWDGPGVDFSSIEDVQLVIEYRYWNRSRVAGAEE